MNGKKNGKRGKAPRRKPGPQNDALFLLHKGNQKEVKGEIGINTDSNKPRFAQAKPADV
ncbi:MAG: hypothetical protein MUO63_10250 [Desulfobulbaceae bacterium]|nr:hypothetical protein [Desulfobulbaceae bacterium]